MSTPAAVAAAEFLRRVFPEPTEGDDDVSAAEADRVPLRGVDERRQRQLERHGDPDRESW